MPQQIEKAVGFIRAHKLIAISTFAYAILTLGHIPLSTLNTLFDKNQAVEFFNVLMVATLFGAIIVRKRNELRIPRALFALVGALLVALFTSANILVFDYYYASTEANASNGMLTTMSGASTGNGSFTKAGGGTSYVLAIRAF
jgi:hypothetical protein